MANKPRDKLTHDLLERLKELNCLYGLSRIIDTSGYQLNVIFQKTVELIPGSWQYPEITSAMICADKDTYKSENFRKSRWLQTSKVSKFGENIGHIAVYYRKKMPKAHEGPFLKEERDLLEAIAERLGKVVERVALMFPRKNGQESLRCS